MIVQNDPSVHLTYCLNIHRGETWSENFTAICEHATAVRDRVSVGKPFGLGLRLSNAAARELASAKAREELKQFFSEQNLYAFTINGFPFGQFHDARVKENVYAPDWRTTERRDYTKLLADILTDLLPDGMSGSISTVPGSFKPWIKTAADVRAMAQMLTECAIYFAQIESRTGKELHLGLEPEPACFLETTDEAIQFFNDALLRDAGKKTREIIRRHIGICFDTCHVAIQFEDLVESLRKFENAGIRISKIQLSAALRARANAESWRALEPFCEPVYLHQTKARSRSASSLLSWIDLPEALREPPAHHDIEEARVHFHVPLFCEKYGVLESTASLLTRDFFAKISDGRAPHWEIETYTFDVLPPELRVGDVAESIAREFEWLTRIFPNNLRQST